MYLQLLTRSGGRDLTGYENGTGTGKRLVKKQTKEKNPYTVDRYVSIQRWIHDFDKFNAMED